MLQEDAEQFFVMLFFVVVAFRGDGRGDSRGIVWRHGGHGRWITFRRCRCFVRWGRRFMIQGLDADQKILDIRLLRLGLMQVGSQNADPVPGPP